VTPSSRSSKKILAPDTWESLEFNLGMESITLSLVPQLFMLELMVFANYNMDLIGEGP
jgi:hypothetical protein